MAHKDDYIIHKTIKTDEKRGTITLSVSFRVAEHPRGKNIKKYSNEDALRWLTEGGVKVGELVKGCTTTNYVGGKPPGTKPEGTWVFKTHEVVKPKPRRKPSKPKVKATKKTTVDNTSDEAVVAKLSDEFDGLNYDGDQPTAKKTRKSKKTKTTSEG
jgi:hypothetical protein